MATFISSILIHGFIASRIKLESKGYQFKMLD